METLRCKYRRVSQYNSYMFILHVPSKTMFDIQLFKNIKFDKYLRDKKKTFHIRLQYHV